LSQQFRHVEELLSTGVFAYRMQAEAGSTVSITSATTALVSEFTADGEWLDLTFDVPAGEHTITIAVLDPFGNETVRELAAAVTRPMSTGGWLVLGTFILLFAGAARWAGTHLRARLSSDRRTATGPPSA
jgi:hypothetical protein